MSHLSSSIPASKDVSHLFHQSTHPEPQYAPTSQNPPNKYHSAHALVQERMRRIQERKRKVRVSNESGGMEGLQENNGMTDAQPSQPADSFAPGVDFVAIGTERTPMRQGSGLVTPQQARLVDFVNTPAFQHSTQSFMTPQRVNATVVQQALHLAHPTPHLTPLPATSAPHQPTQHASIILHNEILSFIDIISETPEERRYRDSCIKLIEQYVKEVDSTARVCTYGSYACNLMIPGSDVDIYVDTEHVKSKTAARNFLSALHNLMTFNEMAFKKLENIVDARVPILKVQEQHTGIWIDIHVGFNTEYDPRPVATFTKLMLAEYPAVRPLCMVIKYHLQQCGLSVPYESGLASYAVFLMVLHFVKFHAMNRESQIHREMTLGRLLVEFLELYGFYFHYHRVAMHFHGARAFVPSSNFHGSYMCVRIENPLRQGTYLDFDHSNMSTVRYIFKLAFGWLTSGYTTSEDGILGRMIVEDFALRKRRLYLERE